VLDVPDEIKLKNIKLLKVGI